MAVGFLTQQPLPPIYIFPPFNCPITISLCLT